MARIRTLSFVGAVLVGILHSLLGGSAVEPASWAAGDDLAPPKVRILTGERTTLAEVRFFRFSCEASNLNKLPLMFVGYRPDSFDPPIEDGIISPIHTIQFQEGGKWKEYPQGWCGTGIDGILLPAGRTKKFGFAVPVDLAGKVVRVGIRWSRRLEFAVAKPEAFQVAWSEPFELKQIDDAKEKMGTKPALKTGGMTHSKPDRGLAAFLISDGTRFKVGEPISLSYGVIDVGARSAQGKVKPLKVVSPDVAADPNNRSWFSVTGPAGRQLAYRGEFVSRFRVQPADVVVLGPGGFVGKTRSDLNLAFDLETPGKYHLVWHYEAGGFEGTWAGKLASTEILIEIVP